MTVTAIMTEAQDSHSSIALRSAPDTLKMTADFCDKTPKRKKPERISNLVLSMAILQSRGKYPSSWNKITEHRAKQRPERFVTRLESPIFLSKHCFCVALPKRISGLEAICCPVSVNHMLDNNVRIV